MKLLKPMIKLKSQKLKTYKMKYTKYAYTQQTCF